MVLEREENIVLREYRRWFEYVFALNLVLYPVQQKVFQFLKMGTREPGDNICVSNTHKYIAMKIIYL